LQQFTLAFALTLVATTIISTMVPALGAYQQLGLSPSDYAHITPGGYLDQLRDFPRVRDGSLRALEIVHLVGIITFPSFHAAACVLYLWALWAIWWMRPIMVLTNGLMLLATPIGGGHYFVDVFAGMALAVLAIAAAKWLGAWLTKPLAQPAQAMPDGVIATQ
jgi:PAP2 superfamily